MLRLLIISVASLLSLTALGVAERSQPNDLMNIVAQIDNEHVAAWNAKSPKDLIDLFTDDAGIIPDDGGGGFTTHEAMLADTRRYMEESSNHTMKPIKAEVLADNIILAATRWTALGHGKAVSWNDRASVCLSASATTL